MEAFARCVIVGGAPIDNYERIKSHFKNGDYFIYCDCGLKHEEKFGRKADLIIGDFDSYDRPSRDTEMIVLPRVKDDTDTSFAVKEALKRDFKDFLLVGASGARFDHSFVNISLLLYLKEKGCKAILADDYSVMEMINDNAEVEDKWPFFSLLAIGGPAKGVNISGSKFPLKNGIITPEDQYATSNEVIPGETAKISVSSGMLLLIKDY